MSPKQVIAARDVSTVYEVPLSLAREGLAELLLDQLQLPKLEPNLSRWEDLVSRIKNAKKTVKIGIVGKYVELPDAYKSLNEALFHGGIANGTKVELLYINAEQIDAGTFPHELFEADALVVPIGFGHRGGEGKIRAIRYAREHKVPMFGICFGMQCMVIEFARHVAGLPNVTSAEFDESSSEQIIYKLRDLLGVEALGGTMRLGAYPCVLGEGTLARKIYGQERISERHRHRYEVNQRFLPALREHGLVFSGMSPDGKFVEIVELPGHPWFLGCQFHPEYRSKPFAPHPLFVSFIEAALAERARRGVDARASEALEVVAEGVA